MITVLFIRTDRLSCINIRVIIIIIIIIIIISTDVDQRLQTEDYKKVVLPGACGFNWFSAKHKKLGKFSRNNQK